MHGLVNNAGIYQPAALTETDDALWQRHIQINQYGCFLGMKAVVPAMERSGGGSIVNISSVAGLQGSPGSFAYAATKWALRGMTKSAAIDLGGRKIRVNSVHPGPIDTDMIAFRTPEQREERIVMAGTANLARFRHDFPDTVYPVLEALEEQVVLMRLLGEAASPSVTVLIGAETGLQGASVVSAGYRAGGQAVAKLGVLGPTRMDYPGTMGAVRAVARYVGQILMES